MRWCPFIEAKETNMPGRRSVGASVQTTSTFPVGYIQWFERVAPASSISPSKPMNRLKWAIDVRQGRISSIQS